MSVLKCATARSTASVHFTKTAARIAVRTGLGERPSEEQLAEVVNKANALVAAAQTVYTIDMPREEAEARFGALMFDSFRISPAVTTLKVGVGWWVVAA